MFSAEYLQKVNKLYNEVENRLKTVHIGCFKGSDKPLLLISDTYPGVWLEHVYDAVFFAKLNPQYTELAKNTIMLFIDNQTADGQLPCYVWDGNKVNSNALIGYSQIQECVSFAALCLEVYKMTGDKHLLKTCYEACKKWISWLDNNRKLKHGGLVEMFVGYDTGHDNSGRLNGLSCRGLYSVNGIPQNASVLPDDNVAPVAAVDMNANYYASLSALCNMAEILGLEYDAKEWNKRRSAHKKEFFNTCLDRDDCFFYDVDKDGNKRKYRSCTVFHLFMEGVLDIDDDCDIIEEIYNRYIKDPSEFWTEFPFPSMSVSDSSFGKITDKNCWGYFSQGLLALRATLWMDKYGFSSDFDLLCEKWIRAWTDAYNELKFGQELDPFTGHPSACSEWYSSCMLFYIYAVRRLGLIK